MNCLFLQIVFPMTNNIILCILISIYIYIYILCILISYIYIYMYVWIAFSMIADFTFHRMSLTRSMSSEPADQDIIYGNEDIDYFINGFKKISGSSAQLNTTVTSLNKDISSKSNYRSGLSRTYSNRSDDTTASDGMSFLKGRETFN